MFDTGLDLQSQATVHDSVTARGQKRSVYLAESYSPRGRHEAIQRNLAIVCCGGLPGCCRHFG